MRREEVRNLIFSWFDTREVRQFGTALAKFIIDEMPADARTRETKFAAKAGKTLQKAARQLQDFKATHKLNPYKQAKLANAFVWGLRDAKCPTPYADEKGASVLLRMRRVLEPLLRDWTPGCHLVRDGGPLPAATDFHCPLLSLPMVMATRLDSAD